MNNQVRDIVVTTPKSQIAVAAQEAEWAKAQQDKGQHPFYFRNLGKREPKHVDNGSRVYYVEHGYIYGFGVVGASEFQKGEIDEVTKREFGAGFYVYIFADSWKWITPIPYKGFQGWRYAPDEWRQLEVIGDWLDPKPMGEMVSA